MSKSYRDRPREYLERGAFEDHGKEKRRHSYKKAHRDRDFRSWKEKQSYVQDDLEIPEKDNALLPPANGEQPEA